MRRWLLTFFCLVLSSLSLAARSQTVPAAAASTFSLSAGGMGSVFQPDYAGEGIAQTSPNRLYGAGVYVDARFTRWLQIEAEGRWLHFNEYNEINENNYLIGPRFAAFTFHGLTPYGKLLVGWGSGSFLTGRSFVVSYGGGVDYRLTKRFTLRAFDIEYQQWPVANITIRPYGGSAGVSYTIF